MIHLKKHQNTDGEEFICAADVLEMLDENRPSTQEVIGFLSLVEAEMNYYVTRDLTSYGSPSLERYIGRVEGYCMAKGWEQEDNAKEMRISKGKKLLFLIEKPLPKEKIDGEGS